MFFSKRITKNKMNKMFRFFIKILDELSFYQHFVNDFAWLVKL